MFTTFLVYADHGEVFALRYEEENTTSFNLNHFRTRVPQARTAERVGLQPREEEAGLRLQPQLEPQQVLARQAPKKLLGEPV